MSISHYLTADDAGERPVAVLLPGEVDEAGPDGGGLALPDLLQADGGRRVVVRRLVAHTPPHVHHCGGSIHKSRPQTV